MMLRNSTKLAAISAIALAASLSTADAQAVRAGFDSFTLPPNDDDSTGLVDIGFNIDFFGVETPQLYVNNNGNVTLNAALSTYTPFDLTSTNSFIIAPFFADVDTCCAGSPVTYGAGTVDGLDAFGVNWVNVDYYSGDSDHTNRNSFQLVLIDQGNGNFDLEFNYDQIQWEAGEASESDPNGLGGFSARVGYSNGTGEPGTFFELPGSAVNGAFLDSGPSDTALILNSLNSDVLGRYIFFARNGQIVIVEGNDGGIMATESAVMMVQAQAEDLRQVVRANADARTAALESGSAMVMSQNGPSNARFSVWTRIGGGLVNADFGEDLDLTHFLAQIGVEAGLSRNLAAGVGFGFGQTFAEAGNDKLDGDALMIQPYVAFMDGPLTVVGSVSYTNTNYDDSTDVIDSGDRFVGTLSAAYAVPVGDATMIGPYGFLAGGVEKLDASDDEDLDFLIARAGVELSRSLELLNTGTMNVYGSLGAEYVSTNEPELSAALVLSDYDDSRLGGRVEAGLDFTVSGTNAQLFASVYGSGLMTDAPGFGGRIGIKIPF